MDLAKIYTNERLYKEASRYAREAYREMVAALASGDHFSAGMARAAFRDWMRIRREYR